METELIKEIREGLKKDENWVESWDSRHLHALCAMNQDILKKEVPAEFIARHSHKMPMPRIIQRYFSRYRLYSALRKHGRCKRSKHAEEVLKKSASKGN